MDTGVELQAATVTNKKKKEEKDTYFFSFDFYPLGRKVRQSRSPSILPSSSPPFLSKGSPGDCENMSILNSIFPYKDLQRITEATARSFFLQQTLARPSQTAN